MTEKSILPEDMLHFHLDVSLLALVDDEWGPKAETIRELKG